MRRRPSAKRTALGLTWEPVSSPGSSVENRCFSSWCWRSVAMATHMFFESTSPSTKRLTVVSVETQFKPEWPGGTGAERVQLTCRPWLGLGLGLVTGEEGQRKDAPAAEERDCEPDGACPHRRCRAAGNQRDEALDGIEEKKGVMRVKQHGSGGAEECAQASSL